MNVVLTHFLTNRDRYTKDVQAIFDMFQNFQDKDKEEDKGEGKDKQKIGNRIRNFSNYLQSNYDKYVNNQTEPAKTVV